MNCKDLSATLLKNISRLLIEADDYNVFITVGEEPNVEIFQAHSVILRAMSPYFHAALSINWAQKAGTIRLDDETSDLNLVELLTASDELVLMDLVDYIQEYIISLDRIWYQKNLIQVFNTVSCYEGVFEKLRDHCIELISVDPQLLFNSEEFSILQEEALILILKQNKLQIREVELWNYLIQWGIFQSHLFEDKTTKDLINWSSEDFETLEKILHNSVPFIRFFQMLPEEYFYKVRPYKKLLPKQLKDDLKLYFIIPNSNLTTTILPPRIPKFMLNSSIITLKQSLIISSWIDYKDDSSMYTSQQENPYNLILLLRGNRDGFGVEEFREKVFKQGPTIVVIHLAGSKDIIGGYNPLDWTGSNKFNQSTDSFIFSFRSEKKSSITTLSRVAKEKSAISDDDGHFIGFGHGDLKIFQSVCQKKDYMCPIHDLHSFQMSNYEVFKVVKKEIN
uniref:Kelch-like protein 17 n=1 Tax=Rhizophagus irregularis (strain DAOM 181602 / DAOM 197198 / MUCL 43194) TaxID=747089 RepID=U9U136_RHIID